ncbi:MAG TPA: tRNA (adenosine(37)-N6)-threonylcarbamoyltransferase complex dimerization subunit type 1 TsaB [Anaerolineae bacterium]|nr:tRNA (adenosine(37)-N6)-threonylcarbamoyltransferase complex dimerization subunit type 1 TsaB [Anaerolineae bacterium]
MILAIDTSTQWMGLAILSDSRIIHEKTWRTYRRHTVELAPAVSQMLLESGKSMSDIQAAAIALGPGSFTSLRIGLAFVKGLALAQHIPIVGIPSLDIIATMQPPSTLPLICVLPAGRHRLAAAHYIHENNQWQAVQDPYVTTAKKLEASIPKTTIISGELTAEDRKTLARRWKNVILTSPANSLRRPAYLAEIAWYRLNSGQSDDPSMLTPIYLHTANTIIKD